MTNIKTIRDDFRMKTVNYIIRDLNAHVLEFVREKIPVRLVGIYEIDIKKRIFKELYHDLP